MMNDKITEEILNCAAELADREIGEKLEEPDEEIVFSKEHEDKMKKFFRKERRKQSMKKFLKYAGRAACILLAIITVSGALIYNVDAWRVKVLNFVIDVGQPNTEYNFSDNGEFSYSDDDIIIDYIPDGFEMERGYSSSPKLFILFVNGDDYFQVIKTDLDMDSSVDTENATVENTSVNGREAVYISKEDVAILMWHNDEYVFRVQGNISREEIFKIAESIKE